MKTSILISGAKGFLARNLIRQLRGDFDVYGLAKQAETVDGVPIFSSLQTDKITLEPDFLILCHAAVASGKDSVGDAELHEVNVALTERLADKFSSSRIIYISTASIYDADCNPIFEDSPEKPQSVYAESKLLGEKAVQKKQNSVIIRLSSLFGNGMKENTIIPNYTNQALQTKTIEVWGKGERKQNYISVTDACQFIAKTIAVFDEVVGQKLLAVSKKEYTNAQLASIIADATNSTINYTNQDRSKSLRYNNDRTCGLLHWAPESDFEKEIQHYIEWKRKQF